MFVDDNRGEVGYIQASHGHKKNTQQKHQRVAMATTTPTTYTTISQAAATII